MKTKMVISLLFILNLFQISAEAVLLEWVIPVNERLEIVRTAKVYYLNDRVLIKRYGERNIINLSCYKNNNIESSVKGDFTIYQREDATGYLKNWKNIILILLSRETDDFL